MQQDHCQASLCDTVDLQGTVAQNNNKDNNEQPPPQLAVLRQLLCALHSFNPPGG